MSRTAPIHFMRDPERVPRPPRSFAPSKLGGSARDCPLAPDRRRLSPGPRATGSPDAAHGRWLRAGAPVLAGVLALACASSQSTAPAASPPSSSPSASSSSPSPSAAEAPLPLDPGTRIGTLPNGLRYYLRRNKEPERRAAFRLLVNAGSVLETDSQQGLAHYVEHMAFNGTRLFKSGEIFDFLEKNGMRAGQHTNAHTGFDETVYRLEIPTEDQKVVDRALLILQQIAGEISFDPNEVNKERGVMLEDRRLRLGANWRMVEKLYPMVMQGSRYAERLPVGKKEILEKATVEDLRAYYRRWYRPDLMAVVAVGDFDEVALEKQIQTVFAPLPRPASAPDRPSLPLPDRADTSVLVFKDKEQTETDVTLYQRVAARPTTTAAHFREDIVEYLYHRMLNARFDEIERAANPPFLSAESSRDSFARGKEFLVQSATVKQGEVAAGLAALSREVGRVDRFGFVATELQRQKANLLVSYQRAVKEKDKTRSDQYAAEASDHFLNGNVNLSQEARLALAEQLLPTITLEEVNRLARESISRRNRVLFVRSPEEGQVPAAAELLTILGRTESEKLEPYVDDVSEGPLVAKLPPPGPVVDSRRIPEVGVTEWRLRNGVRVVLKPTDFKNDEILVSAVSPGGHSRAPDAQFQTASRANDIVRFGGLGNLSLTQVRKALAGKAIGLQTYIDELEDGLSGRASPQDLETLLQLIHLVFTSPRRDNEAFAAYMASVREAVARRLADPATVFWDRWQAIYFDNHLRMRPPVLKDLTRVSLDGAIRFYKQRFADAGDFTFVFVGKLDPDKVKPLVERYLGALPGRGGKDPWKDVGARPFAGKKRFQLKNGQEAKSTVAMQFMTDARWSRPEEHLLESAADVLSLRLRDVLREDLGATYHVDVSGSIVRRPFQGSWARIEFSCAPENAQKLIDTVNREIAKAKAEGFAPDLLAKVKASQLRGLEEGLRTNDYWLGMLTDHARWQSDPRLILTEKALTEQLDAPAVQAAIRRYFDDKRHLLGLLEPAAAPAAAAAPKVPAAAAAAR